MSKRIEVNGLKDILTDVSLYGLQELEFLPIEKYTDYPIHCKEELGARCVEDGINEIVIITPENITDEQVVKIKDKLHKFEKKVKVRCSKVARTKDCDRAIYFKYSPRWHRNSVAHSIWATMARLATIEATKQGHDYNDKDHIDDAKWLLNFLEKKGFSGVFGPQKHHSYDTGMVNLMTRLDDLDGYLKPCEKNFSEPKPQRADFSDYEGYRYAVEDWQYDRENWEMDYYDSFEYDNRVPDNHAYKKIEKQYRKDFKCI